MSRVKRLIDNVAAHLRTPWQAAAAPGQRVVFAVYPPEDERHLRLHLRGLREAVTASDHGYHAFDLEHTFGHWLGGQKYAERYFRQPHLLGARSGRYLDYIEEQFSLSLKPADLTPDHVVCLHGVGSVFKQLSVKELVDRLAPLVPGRLLVLFPGSYAHQNYRLLNAYDGWNYLAVPITSDLQA